MYIYNRYILYISCISILCPPNIDFLTKKNSVLHPIYDMIYFIYLYVEWILRDVLKIKPYTKEHYKEQKKINDKRAKCQFWIYYFILENIYYIIKNVNEEKWIQFLPYCDTIKYLKQSGFWSESTYEKIRRCFCMTKLILFVHFCVKQHKNNNQGRHRKMWRFLHMNLSTPNVWLRENLIIESNIHFIGKCTILKFPKFLSNIILKEWAFFKC